MKTLFLIAGSLIASLTGAQFPAFRTANAAEPPPAAPGMEALLARLDTQEVELAKLRAQTLPAAVQPSSSTVLLCKGANVDPENVHWRIAAGLSPAHAVEVALRERLEADAQVEETKKKKK